MPHLQSAQAQLDQIQLDREEIQRMSRSSTDFFVCTLSLNNIKDILLDSDKDDAIGFGLAVRRQEHVLDAPTLVIKLWKWLLICICMCITLIQVSCVAAFSWYISCKVSIIRKSQLVLHAINPINYYSESGIQEPLWPIWFHVFVLNYLPLFIHYTCTIPCVSINMINLKNSINSVFLLIWM